MRNFQTLWLFIFSAICLHLSRNYFLTIWRLLSQCVPHLMAAKFCNGSLILIALLTLDFSYSVQLSRELRRLHFNLLSDAIVVCPGAWDSFQIALFSYKKDSARGAGGKINGFQTFLCHFREDRSTIWDIQWHLSSYLAKFKMTFAENHILFVHIFDPWKIRNETKMFHFTFLEQKFKFNWGK